ncbi:MAG: hypothetical protein KKB50_13215, partial [Planctomycetes bacterium]|nr:hypothetical protein [Planctomycetota bacterium]
LGILCFGILRAHSEAMKRPAHCGRSAEWLCEECGARAVRDKEPAATISNHSYTHALQLDPLPGVLSDRHGTLFHPVLFTLLAG